MVAEHGRLRPQREGHLQGVLALAGDIGDDPGEIAGEDVGAAQLVGQQRLVPAPAVDPGAEPIDMIEDRRRSAFSPGSLRSSARPSQAGM